MRSTVIKETMECGNESLSLFSRLAGLGIAGFAGHAPVERNATTIDEGEHHSAGNKKSRVVKFCRNGQNCQQKLICQSGNYENSDMAVDLWFYLSSQS